MVHRKTLTKPPLVEAIFELRWVLQSNKQNIPFDPHYQLLVGRMYDRLKEDYPIHEPLPTAAMPDDMVSYVAQHQFRRIKDGWPLVQIGPGVLTVNDTERYERVDFETRINKAVGSLFNSYEDYEKGLEVNKTLLRYIDAVEVNSEAEEVLDFLKNKLKVTIQLDSRLFQDTGVEKRNPGLDVRLSFPCSAPKGLVHLRICTGHKEKAKAIVWETMIESQGKDTPKSPKDISKWAETADELIHDWFFKLIEGNLLRSFE